MNDVKDKPRAVETCDDRKRNEDIVGKITDKVMNENNGKTEEESYTEEELPEMENKAIQTAKNPREIFTSDGIDEYYERVPWMLGAIGRLLGLQFAPINIPIERRLQTFAVFFWMSTFLFMGYGSLIFLLYLFFYTDYWWISLAYLTWFMGDKSICNRGGRRIPFLRKWSLWKHKKNFYPTYLIKTAELDPSKNYIMCYHPHGILCSGAFCHFATEATGFDKVYPGLTPYLLTLEGHFLLPLYREFFMASGAVSATRESMDYLLGGEETGRALCLVVGGARESLDAHPGKAVLYLNKRKGFCKMALRHGASLVPMFSFGENEVYDQYPNPPGSRIRRAQEALQKIIGLAPCIFAGRGIFQYSFGIVPYRKPIFTVVGSPIDSPQIRNPTPEQICDLHARYVEALTKLYNKYKHVYATDPKVELVIT